MTVLTQQEESILRKLEGHPVLAASQRKYFISRHEDFAMLQNADIDAMYAPYAADVDDTLVKHLKALIRQGDRDSAVALYRYCQSTVEHVERQKALQPAQSRNLLKNFFGW